MNYFLMIFFILFSLSCDKSLESIQKVSYTFNGQKIKIGDSQLNFLFKDSLAPLRYEYILGLEDDYGTNGLQIYYFIDSLPLNTPIVLPLASFKYNGLLTTNNLIDNSKFTFLITRYTNGSIDGTFRGRINAFFSNSQIVNDTIADGEFKNIPVSIRY